MTSGSSVRPPFPFDRLEVEFSGPTPARGSQLLAFRVDRTIIGVGPVLVPTGVLSVSDPVPGGAVVLVVDVFDRITMGDFIAMLPAFTVQPGVRVTTVNTGTDATIVAFAADRALHETHDIAFLDQGSDNGVKVGDEYVAGLGRGNGYSPGPGGSVCRWFQFTPTTRPPKSSRSGTQSSREDSGSGSTAECLESPGAGVPAPRPVR